MFLNTTSLARESTFGKSPSKYAIPYNSCVISKILKVIMQSEFTKNLSELKQNDFDLDSYKILVKPIMLKTVKVEKVDV
jgi:hypothetical protein